MKEKVTSREQWHSPPGDEDVPNKDGATIKLLKIDGKGIGIEIHHKKRTILVMLARVE